MAKILDNIVWIIDEIEDFALTLPEWRPIGESWSHELEVLYDEIVEKELPKEIARDIGILVRETKEFQQRIDLFKLEEIRSDNFNFSVEATDFESAILLLEEKIMDFLSGKKLDNKKLSGFRAFTTNLESDMKNISTIYQNVIDNLLSYREEGE